MSYQKKKSIVYQVKERINSMDAMAQSKYAAKMDCLKNGSAPGGHIEYGDNETRKEVGEVHLCNQQRQNQRQYRRVDVYQKMTADNTANLLICVLFLHTLALFGSISIK